MDLFSDLFAAILLLVPFAVAFFAVWQRMNGKRTANTAGYVYNGSRFVYYVFFALILCWIIQIFFADKLNASVVKGEGIVKLLGIAAFQLLYFLCYVLVAFKPATAAEMEKAKAEKNVFLELTANAVGGLLGTVLSTLMAIPSILLAVLNPINIVRTVGSTIYYTVGTVAQSIASIIGAVFVVAAVIGLICLLSGYFLILVLIVVWIAVVVRYVINAIIYRNGPRENF